MTILAHGIGQSPDLPLPLDLVLQAGAATVVLSFLGAAFLWRRPRLGGAGIRQLGTARFLRYPVLLFSLYVVGNAFFGPHDESNPAAHAIFVWLWVGLIPLSVVFGPIWRPVNPLRTLFVLLRFPENGTRSTSGRAVADRGTDGGPTAASTSGGTSVLIRENRTTSILERVGHWPATVCLVGFTWWELVAPNRADTLVVGTVLAIYGVVQLALARTFGLEWFAHGDCFEVYSELAGRLSPIRWQGPLAGVVALHDSAPDIGLAAFIAAWWGSTIFDSASASPWWAAFTQKADAPVLLGTAGLFVVCGVVFAGVRKLAGKLDVTASLIPIAVGYTLAHYLTLLIIEGPRGVLLLIQQWGLAENARWDIAIIPGVVSIAQITLILLGHVLGVIVAHDMALREGPQRPALGTLADELPIVLFMIACTWIGLFLLFVR